MIWDGVAVGDRMPAHAVWCHFNLGGSRVVPIPYDANATVITSLLSSVNGVLFTGAHVVPCALRMGQKLCRHT